ncbi:MAG: hypothetical protein RLZZ387_1933 [Chloroflexota bacterium]|jgi:glycosyltransferase involved in cell wall biosynthesis
MSGPELMTEALVRHLGSHPEIEYVHLNTQISRSLADKGKRPLAKMLKSLGQIVRYLWLLVTYRPGVAYLPLTNSRSFAGFLRDALVMVPAMLMGVRVIFRLHGGYCHYMHYNGWRAWLVRAVLGRVTMAMVQGRNLTRLFDGVIAPERVAVVVNGVEGAPFATAREHMLASKQCSERPTVLFVGLLCREKGALDILRAAPHILGTTFVLMGEWASPEERDEAMAIVRERGLAERVSFPGVLSGQAKYDAFARADVFVFPSYYRVEGHAVVTVEALAAGLPIICTDHGALGESVQDGWNGYIVHPRDPSALAERVRQVLSDPELRRVMGERSRALYEEKFTLPRFVESWVGTLIQGVAPHTDVRHLG